MRTWHRDVGRNWLRARGLWLISFVAGRLMWIGLGHYLVLW